MLSCGAAKEGARLVQSGFRRAFRAAAYGILTIAALLIVSAALVPLLISTDGASGAESGEDLAPDGSRFAEIPGPGETTLQIHIRDRGAASEEPAWIFLHGFTFNAFSWDPLIQELPADRRLLAYDQLPYGLSSKPAAPKADLDFYTRDAAVDRLWHLLEAEKIEQPVLVANSAGAVIALEAARLKPQRIAGLILINPMADLDRPELPAFITSLPQTWRLSLWGARWLGETEALLERSYHDPGRITDDRREKFHIHTRMADWDRAWGGVLKRSLTERLDVGGPLDTIHTPTLVVVSEEDQVIPPEDSLNVAAQIPHAEASILADCGHVPQEECPNALRQLLAEKWPQVTARYDQADEDP